MSSAGGGTDGSLPSRDPPGRRSSARRRGGYLAGVAALAGVLVAGALQGSGAPAVDAAPVPTTIAAPADVLLDSLPESAAPVRVSELGPLLPVPAGWELFATGSTTMARVQLATGRVTRTTFPGLVSSGPLFFVAGPDRALIRPLDYVPGYVVADDQPARQLTAPALGAGPLIAGPDPAHVWTHSGDGLRPWVLTDLDGNPAGPVIDAPVYGGEATSDGAGGLLFTDDYGGAYQASPAGLRRITHGRVLAVGPTGWLTADCDDRHRCATAMVDRATFTPRPVPVPVTEHTAPPGVIAPDGSAAAVLTRNTEGGIDLHLVHLDTGADRAVAATLSENMGEPGTVLWAPDSRSLFTIIEGRPVVVDAGTTRTRVLDPDLPPISLLALRVAAP